MDTTVAGNDSDSEVFEGENVTTRQPPHRNRMSSSSSSRKSSFTDDLQDRSTLVESGQDDSGRRSSSVMSGGRTGVVEWKPDVKEVQNGDQRMSSSGGGDGDVDGESESPIDESEFSGTVTVTIDPPNDLYSDSSTTRTHSGDLGIPFHLSQLADDEFDLFGSLDDVESDSEGEESDIHFMKKLCLLSR